ncbi:uracil-DNA glycosylase superfamily [Dinoroseobacter shibae DFL 12 = DSM 16493]|jgi:uracil-DNA glycosylase|uniref:Uracil-DNA glycosylase superfamily n=1 Tax=Dinoroseobacter shibae (strain DSM 16493 / NCIMB 14021 / DFL 12) TaxID=398580 RepID=A8LPL1_DINSH|nr:uracil-DNA glycosylase family protein [Dinoroseobacter shibae]ABV92334.1 uracil-DNA glycosylase superfamily [Dinoroseobacter shibae DFL 12 = DSM 16493]URF47282.1 uracil-DNA glycosylase family protein [Dinoroseobacter shibae]URF51593.1 uracil-DNA glycosylase family protein [Dinoroseobacter shibae]
MSDHALAKDLAACTLCASRFATTASAHRPRPVVWFRPTARVLIASQAPGMRAHKAARPFTDPSGVRLRAWLGVNEDTFYDKNLFAIVPMGFCFPGYDAKGSDLPPPRICAQTWRAPILAGLPQIALTLLIGGYAQKWHLGPEARAGVTETVRRWRDYAPDVFPLPHPSWRNTAWLNRNPWFEAECLPALRARLGEVLKQVET